MRKSQINRDTSRLFFRQTIRIRSGQRFDECALAMVDVTCGGENEMFLCHLITTKDTKSTKDNSALTSILSLMERRIPMYFHDASITLRDNASNSIFVSFVSFVVAFCAGGANGIDDEIVLMRKDRTQIEFEATAGDVTNDRRTGTAKSTLKILERGVLGQKVDRD